MILVISFIVLLFAMVTVPIAFIGATASGLHERHVKMTEGQKAGWKRHETYLKTGYYKGYKQVHGDYPPFYYEMERLRYKFDK